MAPFYGIVSGCSPCDSSLGLILFTPCSSPWIFHVPVFSDFLWILVHFGLHFHTLIPCLLRDTVPGLSRLLVKSRWKSSWPHSICFLNACKTSIIQIISTSTTILSCSPVSLYHGYKCLWVSGWLITINQILRNKFPTQPFWSRVFWILFSKQSFTFVSFSLWKMESCWFLTHP